MAITGPFKAAGVARSHPGWPARPHTDDPAIAECSSLMNWPNRRLAGAVVATAGIGAACTPETVVPVPAPYLRPGAGGRQLVTWR